MRFVVTADDGRRPEVVDACDAHAAALEVARQSGEVRAMIPVGPYRERSAEVLVRTATGRVTVVAETFLGYVARQYPERW